MSSFARLPSTFMIHAVNRVDRYEMGEAYTFYTLACNSRRIVTSVSLVDLGAWPKCRQRACQQAIEEHRAV